MVGVSNFPTVYLKTLCPLFLRKILNTINIKECEHHMKNERNKNNAFVAQQKLAVIQLLWELPNYIWLMISAILSKSMLVWMDLIDSTHVIFRAAFVLALSRKLKKNLSYQYNYGTGKVEAIASLCCDIMLLGSLITAAWFAVNDLLNPSQPTGIILLVVLLKLENVIFDVYILAKQRKNKIDSKFYCSEYSSNMKNLMFDAGLMIIFISTYFLREVQWASYLSPIFSLGLVVVFIYYSALRMRKSVLELMDTTCDEQTQQNIFKTLVALYDYYDNFIEVKSRITGDQLLIDIYLRFKPETTYMQICEFTEIATKKLLELNPNSVVSIVIQERVKYDYSK